MDPVELEIKDMTESNNSASYLDLILLSLERDGQLHTSIYDKRDNFNFHITNFHSSVAIFQLHPPIASWSRSLYDMPEHAPHMDVYSEGNATFK